MALGTVVTKRVWVLFSWAQSPLRKTNLLLDRDDL